MVSFGEKAKIIKVGNLNDGRSYVITTVLVQNFWTFGVSVSVSGQNQKPGFGR